jgi:hypothetical protein
MYRVRKDGKLLKKKFMSYEEARSWVRKQVRAQLISIWDWSGMVNRNPAINRYGFSITKQGV